MTTLARIRENGTDMLKTMWPTAQKAARFAGGALPGFFLSWAELLGIPSGLYAAYIAAMAADRRPILPPMLGCAAALLMRLVWGLPMRWQMAAALAVLLASPSVLPRHGNIGLMGLTCAALLPELAAGLLGGTQAELLLAVGTMCTGMLAAPVLLRAVQAVRGGHAITGLEERIALGFLALCMASGGGRMLLAGVNLGVLCAAAVTACMAMFLGLSAGIAAGMAGGLALVLAGLPVAVCVCLPAGGFLAGMAQPLGKRWLTCLAFALGSMLLAQVAGCGGAGVLPSMLTAPLALAVLPARCTERLRDFFKRFVSVRTACGDAYAADALAAWEQAMDAMARAVPSPISEEGAHDPAWWRGRLCSTCPDYAACQTMGTTFAAARAEEVWAQRHCREEAWPAALEQLRGLGCGRLYCLREAMDRLRAEEPERRLAYRRACYQRDMLVTHLSAMAGAARRLSQLSGGENWWDEMGSRSIRRELDEQAMPARLLYMRRVEGHACAAIEAESALTLRRLTDDLTRLTSAALSVPMAVERTDGDRLYLCQRPALDVSWGMAGQGAAAGQPSGDSAWLGRLPRGRFLAAVSDGMGQGERAGSESANTVALLRLCMEAGYDRAQTLTAVNGMMLLETGGERFATVDLLCVDLWSGQASLDKLGAAGSWLARGETLVELTGDALPIGIMETVDNRTSLLKLRAGDRLLLMTDGIEDAFPDKETLRRAVEVALGIATPQHAAETLLESAVRACETGRRDDMTAVVVYIENAVSSMRDQRAP